MGYDRPADLDRALEALARGNGTVLAGGTDLYPATDRPALAGNILDITAVAALRGVARSDDGWRIGAATRWSEVIDAIESAGLPPAFDGLKQAAREVGSVQIQNAGTVGGNICNASPAADGVPALLVLDAEVELRSVRGLRRMPLSAFVRGVRRTALEADELMTAVLIPASAGVGRSQFLKLGARKYLVISIAMVAARIEAEAGVVTGAALAVGACSAVATRLPGVEASLVGRPLDQAAGSIEDGAVAASLSPIDDLRADAAYRSRAAAELLRRAVAGAVAP
jgi:CO/xanthine dehydrogenase FAD-binding subunit